LFGIYLQVIFSMTNLSTYSYSGIIKKNTSITLNISFMRKFMFLFFLFFSSAYAFGQNREITGMVKDENGNPLAGASVRLAESTIGASTDADGTFTLSIPQRGE